ncbi:unnamed protein product [Ceutorhynchus assimilis]|uniref:Phosphatidylinositol N-acetylglucosaminyltransferase subunit Q n=1 Tax=Ceutorhynchus assimilis TaxID=467358 RepID=A0A9N9QK28_9CUCU|nr:unnamed protein product [Ceutorhynchus assimilis]
MFTNHNNILVFIPKNFLPDKSGFIQGFYKNHENSEAYYITNSQVVSQCTDHIGYTGKFLTGDFLGKNTIFIEYGTTNIRVNHDSGSIITQVYYDYEAFRNSNVLCNNEEDTNYGIHIRELNEKLGLNKRRTHNNKPNILYWLIVLLNLVTKLFLKLRPLMKSSAIFTHLDSNIKTLKWFLTVLNEERSFSPRIGNTVTAKLIDLILGVAFIYVCIDYKCLIISNFDHISQIFVTNLRELLIYLMGSPIGLKLNYAFNNSLGKFFFCHINLWMVFLHTMQPLLDAIFLIILLPALLGFSCQIAIFSDIISVATFHVYCIYIYAARLFSLQLRGLISLWRLFIGRKSNPLRNRVDSCEYSSNQLFIGTLGFTLLLFLLPTTTMYYTVFAAFRLATLLSFALLSKIKNVISNIPLYIIILWIFRSSSIAGAPQLSWIPTTNNQTQIEIKLTPLSLGQSIEKFTKNNKETGDIEPSFGTVITHLFTGQLM